MNTPSDKDDTLFGVHTVPSVAIPENKALFVSGARTTHTENLTTGEQKQVNDFIDAITLVRLAPTNPQTQQDLIDLVNDPKTIKKAVEGSMEKRQALIDRDPQTEEKK